MIYEDEARLWRAVILQAFADAAAPAANPTAANARNRALRNAARAWLMQPSRDLFDVCRLAGEDLNQVMETARKLDAKGWPDATHGHHRMYITGRRSSDAAIEIDPQEKEEIPRSARAHRERLVLGQSGAAQPTLYLSVETDGRGI
jgi:hypothetical protein